VAGCYWQTGTEKYFSVQSSENSIDSRDPLHEIDTGNVPVGYDHLVGNNNKIRKAAPLSSLHLAADPVDSSVNEDLSPYACDTCNRKFSAGATLRRHRRRHKDCATCIACGHSFCSSALLRHHLQMQCPRKIVACNICCISFIGWPSLSRHTSTTHLAASVCPACGQAFLHTSQLVAHKTVHTTNIYQCRTCSQSFHLLRQVKRHVMKHVTDSDSGCISEGFLKEVSKQGLVAESGLIPDNKDALGILLKDVKSDACHSGYSLSEVVKNTSVSYHQKEVNGPLHPDRAYSLLMPSTDYPLSPASNGHVDGHNIILHFDKRTPLNSDLVPGQPEVDASAKLGFPERVTCAECSRTFKRLSDLHVHMQCHTGEKRYKCSVCSRPFRKSGTLARHMRIHTGERPYICETCGKSYKLLFHLRLHMTVHSSDRPYPCDICSKAFQTATNLKKHRFVHTGAKPFSCPLCLRLFNRCSNMRAHMRTHSDVHQRGVFTQEHVCILCQKKFGNAASFQTHLQTHAHQIALDVGENVSATDSADSFGAEATFCKAEKQQSDDVYHFICPFS